MVLWVGVDDTDSLAGMCTTFLATELVRVLARDYDLIGYPRLVRLNPNIPWKTRGNGAICLRIGHGRGAPRVVGHVDEREIVSYPRGVSVANSRQVADRVAAVVRRWARFEDPTTHPGFVVLRKPAPQRLYWKGVRAVLGKGEVLRATTGLGVVQGYKQGRGVIGASAATAWRPRERTYEILTFRHPLRWGTPRGIERESVISMNRRFPSTFNNYDFENQRVTIAPHSPCPVLFGIRGDRPEDLEPAMKLIRGERPASWLLFETNQGTDDHVRPHGPVERWATVRLRGPVTEAPRDLLGGHVVVRVRGFDVTAYEPSKQFRAVVRRLIPGDQVEVVGAVRDRPRTVNLEKLRILSLARRLRKVANPLCTPCGKRSKSCGRDAGYRCVRCGQRFPESAASIVEVDSGLNPGWYEPPVGSRRHLSKPLGRLIRAIESDSSGPGLLDAQSGDPVAPLHIFDHL